jgi:hypothetical protein
LGFLSHVIRAAEVDQPEQVVGQQVLGFLLQRASVSGCPLGVSVVGPLSALRTLGAPVVREDRRRKRFDANTPRRVGLQRARPSYWNSVPTSAARGKTGGCVPAFRIQPIPDRDRLMEFWILLPLTDRRHSETETR